MQHFYDGQIRRFVTQFIRAFSNFSYKDGAGRNELDTFLPPSILLPIP